MATEPNILFNTQKMSLLKYILKTGELKWTNALFINEMFCFQLSAWNGHTSGCWATRNTLIRFS